MPKKKLNSIDQIHKLARDNGFVVLMIVDEDFIEYDISPERLYEAKHLAYQCLIEGFSEAIACAVDGLENN